LTDIAGYVRIFDKTPEDDLVTKRAAAVKDLVRSYGKGRAVALILQLANDLATAVDAKGSVSDFLSKDIEAAVRKGGAEAFVAKEDDLQVTVCGLIGALETIEKNGPVSGDVSVGVVLAIGLWSALSFQAPRPEPKLEELRSALQSSSSSLVVRSATTSRQRTNVPDAALPAAEPFDAATVSKLANTSYGAAISALRTNAAIDREEIDLLWWVLGDWSELVQRPYSKLGGGIVCALSSGIEAGQMLRRLPGKAHRNLVLRNVTATETLSLAEVLKQTAAEREALVSPFKGDPIINCPAVFPLLNALQTNSAANVKSKIKRPISEWAERALLESASLRVTKLIPVTV
jgi:hypothetical protein